MSVIAGYRETRMRRIGIEAPVSLISPASCIALTAPLLLIILYGSKAEAQMTSSLIVPFMNSTHTLQLSPWFKSWSIFGLVLSNGDR